MADDRRAAIEAAFNDVEEDEVATIVEPKEATVEDKQIPLDLGDTPIKEDAPVKEVPVKTAEVDKVEPASKLAVDRAPQSWRAPQRAKWAALDPEVRQEVLKREREITKTLSDTASARQLQNDFQQVVQPFLGRLQAMNAHPLKAVQELLKADYLLSSAPKSQRAQFMAKLISDYDVDIESLDMALSGKVGTDPVQATVDRLLQERLAPFQKFIQTQEEQAAWREQTETATLSEQVNSMESDPDRYPNMSEVKEDMADIISIQSKKGVYLTLEQAYTRAIAMNPELNQSAVALREAEARRSSAKADNAKAQRALNASKSVGGAPSGAISGTFDANDRRAIIEAAFNAAAR